jgi:hypothetical protein
LAWAAAVDWIEARTEPGGLDTSDRSPAIVVEGSAATCTRVDVLAAAAGVRDAGVFLGRLL